MYPYCNLPSVAQYRLPRKHFTVLFVNDLGLNNVMYDWSVSNSRTGDIYFNEQSYMTNNQLTPEVVVFPQWNTQNEVYQIVVRFPNGMTRDTYVLPTTHQLLLSNFTRVDRRRSS